MTSDTVAALRYPDGLPGILHVNEFCNLMGVSRPTGTKIVNNYPEYTTVIGGKRYVAVGLYQKLSRDQTAVYKETNAMQTEGGVDIGSCKRIDPFAGSGGI